MFESHSRLPHVLPPAAYASAAWLADEVRMLLEPGWHLVGTTAELRTPGSFITVELLGRPVQVRSMDGGWHAFSNVCAHRHCLLSSLPRGQSQTIRCQYHGWEYGTDGRTRGIPEPKNFAPFDRERDRLPVYRIEACGQLLFVSLAAEGPTLREHLGDLYDTCAERFGDLYHQTLAWQSAYEANWKVPVENSVEAYHVPCVHPQSFRADPGESRSVHVLRERRTAFGTRLPFDAHFALHEMFQRAEGSVWSWLGAPITREYWQHHVFPNLLFSFTDTLSLIQCVCPTGPTRSQAIVRQFGRRATRGGMPGRWVAAGWGRFAAAITRTILNEDRPMFPAIQRGLETSPHAGVLGRCEERIHAFQQYVAATCAGAIHGSGPSGTGLEADTSPCPGLEQPGAEPAHANPHCDDLVGVCDGSAAPCESNTCATVSPAPGL